MAISPTDHAVPSMAHLAWHPHVPLPLTFSSLSLTRCLSLRPSRALPRLLALVLPLRRLSAPLPPLLPSRRGRAPSRRLGRHARGLDEPCWHRVVPNRSTVLELLLKHETDFHAKPT